MGFPYRSHLLYQDLTITHGLLQESVIMVRDLFRNKEQTEFIIATIPTMLGINESSRLLKALRKEDIPCHRIIVNQASYFLATHRHSELQAYTLTVCLHHSL